MHGDRADFVTCIKDVSDKFIRDNKVYVPFSPRYWYIWFMHKSIIKQWPRYGKGTYISQVSASKLINSKDWLGGVVRTRPFTEAAILREHKSKRSHPSVVGRPARLVNGPIWRMAQAVSEPDHGQAASQPLP